LKRQVVRVAVLTVFSRSRVWGSSLVMAAAPEFRWRPAIISPPAAGRVDCLLRRVEWR
jgi:hypothetical protein